MALTQKGELWVLEQVIQRSDYNFIKVKLLQEIRSHLSTRREVCCLFREFGDLKKKKSILGQLRACVYIQSAYSKY